MSKIDFDNLDGQSSVASDRNGRLGKLALPLLLVAGVGVLAYVNWPAGPQNPTVTDGNGETFETSNSSIRNFPDEPVKQAAAKPKAASQRVAAARPTGHMVKAKQANGKTVTYNCSLPGNKNKQACKG